MLSEGLFLSPGKKEERVGNDEVFRGIWTVALNAISSLKGGGEAMAVKSSSEKARVQTEAADRTWGV